MKILILLFFASFCFSQTASHSLKIIIEKPFHETIDTIPDGEYWTIVSKELCAPRRITRYEYKGNFYIDTILYDYFRYQDKEFIRCIENEKRIDSLKHLKSKRRKDVP